MKIGDKFVESSAPVSSKASKGDLEAKAMERLKAFNEKFESEHLSEEEKELAALDPETRQYVKDNDNALGSLKVGAEAFGNELAFGIPGIAYENLADPKEVKKYKALKEFHNTADTVGSGLGMAGSLLVGGPVFKGATTAGRAVEGAIAGEKLATKALGSVARYATEGAVMAAPRAMTEAALGDPEAAAESLLYGVGGGVALGGLGAGMGFLNRKLANVGEKALDIASEKIERGLNNPEVAREWLQHKASGAAGKVVGTGVGAVMGHGTGAIIGHKIGDELGERVGEAVMRNVSNETIEKGLAIALKASKYTAEKLNAIPEILETISRKGFTGSTLGGNAFSGFSKLYYNKNEKEAYNLFLNDLSNAQTNPAILPDTIGKSSDVFTHGGAPEIGAAYNQKQFNAIQYLWSQAPKNPNAPKLFQGDDGVKWAPTDAQLFAFKRKLETVNDPFVVLDKLKDGTLTRDNVHALKNVYPKLHQQISQLILNQGLDSKKKVSHAARAKIALLTGVDIDTSMSRASMNALQSTFQQDNSPKPQGDRVKLNLPSPTAEFSSPKI